MMKITEQRQEGRVFAPFDIPAALQTRIGKIKVAWNAGELHSVGVLSDPRPVSLSPAQIRKVGLELRDLPSAEELRTIFGDSRSQLSEDEIALAVVVQDRRAPVRGQHFIGVFGPTEIPETLLITALEEARPTQLMCNVADGFDLVVYVLLAQQRVPTPGQPYRKGTRLAESRLSITPAATSSLTPRSLDDEARKALDLPASAWVHCRMIDPDALLRGLLEESVELYVDEKVLALVGQQIDRSRVFFGQQLFNMPLLVELVGHLSRALIAEPDFSLDDEEPAEALTMVRRLLKLSGADRSITDLCEELRKRPAWVSSHVTAAANTRKNYLNSLQEKIEEQADV